MLRLHIQLPSSAPVKTRSGWSRRIESCLRYPYRFPLLVVPRKMMRSARKRMISTTLGTMEEWRLKTMKSEDKPEARWVHASLFSLFA